MRGLRSGHGKPSADAPSEVDSYRPSEAEAELAREHLKRREARTRAPRVKVIAKRNRQVDIDPDHPSPVMWQVGLERALGTVEAAFANQLLGQLINATSHQPATGADEKALNGALAAMHGIAPRDETEAMLGAQMVASHCLAMEMSRRALTAEYRDTLIDAAGFANKFMRTYAALVEALTRYRGKGEQKVVVEHVHVHQGAQAIIGAVTAGGGGGAKIEEQAQAQCLPYAPGATLRSEDPARDAVPVTGGERQTTVPHARRRQR